MPSRHKRPGISVSLSNRRNTSHRRGIWTLPLLKNWKKYLSASIVGLLFTAFAGSIAPVSAEPVREDAPELGKKLNLPIYVWSDPTKPVKGIIVAIHGLTFYASAFDDFARYMASQGYVFYAPDMRGFGRWKAESAKWNGDNKVHFSQTKEDLLRVADTLRRENPDTKIYALGESLGANFAIWLGSSKPNLINGVICSGPCYKRFTHVRARWATDFATSCWRWNHDLNLEPYINPYLSTDHELTASCLRDPLIMRKMSPVNLVKTNMTNRETLLYVKNLPAGMPMFIIAGEKDAVFKPNSIPELVSRMGCAKTTSVHILKDKGHLLLEHQTVDPSIANLIESWLDKNAQTPQIASDKVSTVSGY
jgi:alpha-beta hydrolase superfamily lysophospholipase